MEKEPDDVVVDVECICSRAVVVVVVVVVEEESPLRARTPPCAASPPTKRSTNTKHQQVAFIIRVAIAGAFSRCAEFCAEKSFFPIVKTFRFASVCVCKLCVYGSVTGKAKIATILSRRSIKMERRVSSRLCERVRWWCSSTREARQSLIWRDKMIFLVFFSFSDCPFRTERTKIQPRPLHLHSDT